jgi:hypothetical protein
MVYDVQQNLFQNKICTDNLILQYMFYKPNNIRIIHTFSKNLDHMD